MAIDTAPRRRAVSGILGYMTGGPGQTPDATPGFEWRAIAWFGYPYVNPSFVEYQCPDVSTLMAGTVDLNTSRSNAMSFITVTADAVDLVAGIHGGIN